MTKIKNISTKATATKAGRVRTTPVSPEDKWNTNKPFHVTQEELWEHIQEIEKGPFMSLEEFFKSTKAWRQELLKSQNQLQ